MIKMESKTYETPALVTFGTPNEKEATTQASYVMDTLERAQPSKERDILLRSLAVLSHSRDNFFSATKCYILLEDMEMLRQSSEAALKKGHLCDATKGFNFLGDKKGLMKVIEAAQKINIEPPHDTINQTLDETVYTYVGEERIRKTVNGFKRWRLHKQTMGYTLSLERIIHIGHTLADQYDISIGVANGGLFPAYVFQLTGLKTKIAHVHKVQYKKTIFRWEDKVKKEDFEGKRVLVVDKDVITGITCKRVLEELIKFNPAEVGIALYHNPSDNGIGSRIHNISAGYDNIHYPANCSYSCLDRAIEVLDAALD